MTQQKLTLYHAPRTRSSSVLQLIEELGAPYELHVLNQKKEEHRAPAYLAINPLGKVPALKHGDAVVTETVACFLYLADAFPDAGLAPRIGDPLRGPYLRWMTLYGAAYEPAVVDRAMQRDAGKRTMSPYGDFDSLFKVITDQLAKGPYILGPKFTAADVLWGSGLAWTTMFKLVPDSPVVTAYLQRVSGRPAQLRAQARDQELAASLA